MLISKGGKSKRPQAQRRRKPEFGSDENKKGGKGGLEPSSNEEDALPPMQCIVDTYIYTFILTCDYLHG